MRPEIKFGLLGGVLFWLWSGMEELLGFHSTRIALGEASSWMALLLLCGCIQVVVGREHRARPLGRLEPWDAIRRAFLLALVYAVLLYVYAVAYSHVLNPGWPDRLLAWHLEGLRRSGAPAAALQEHAASFRLTFSPVGLAFVTLGLYPLFGAVYGLLATLLLNWRAERARRVRP